jgi:hypothetical protein
VPTLWTPLLDDLRVGPDRAARSQAATTARYAGRHHACSYRAGARGHPARQPRLMTVMNPAPQSPLKSLAGRAISCVPRTQDAMGITPANGFGNQRGPTRRGAPPEDDDLDDEEEDDDRPDGDEDDEDEEEDEENGERWELNG